MSSSSYPFVKNIRPYFIEAFHKWIVDNHMTAMLVVNCSAKHPGLSVPSSVIKDGKVVLDLSEDAVDDLSMGLFIKATCYFDHGPEPIEVPISCVLAIYSQETSQGLYFEESLYNPHDPETKELYEEEMRAIQPQINQPATIKDNKLSRSKLQLVRPKEASQDQS